MHSEFSIISQKTRENVEENAKLSKKMKVIVELVELFGPYNQENAYLDFAKRFSR